MTDQERKDAIRFFEWVAEDEAMNYSRLTIEALKAQNDSKESSPTHKALDTISRADAIDAIEKAKTAKAPDGEMYVAKINAEMNIQLLPSVQPEDCDTCKHGYFGDEQCNSCRVRFTSHYERRTDGEIIPE